MTSSAKTLRRFLLPLVILCGCGGRPLGNGSVGSPGSAGSPSGTADAGSSGAAGAGGTGAAGTGGHGAAGAGGTPGTVLIGDTGTIVFAPGSTAIHPREITTQLFRGGDYRCGPVPTYDATGALAVSLLGFSVSGDPGCNLFLSFNPPIPLGTPIPLTPGPPVMVSHDTGPNGEIIDPSFDVGAMSGPFGAGTITLDFGQGLRRAPVLTGPVEITLLAWPQRYGDAIKYRVQAAISDGGFLDFVVTKVLVSPTAVACPPCGQFCQS
jgi:hypothetical protein